jgi:hypothetical protein
VGKFKSSIDGILKSLATTAPAATTSAERQKIDDIENSSAKLFEEIKIMFQDLPSRIERSESSRFGRKKRRFHPGMIEDLMFASKNPIFGIRVGLSLLRDPLPWLYDEGNVLISKLQTSKTPAARQQVINEFQELLMLSTRNPYVEKYMVDSEEEYRLFREVPQMILHAIERMVGEA